MIRTTDSGAIRTVTLDRPDRRNALIPAALDALETAVIEADTPVVFIRGAGSAFCAGADLDSVADLAAQAMTDSSESAVAFARRGQQVATAIETSDVVVVAGIDGPARGGGVELALACDIRVATPAGSFAEPGVTFGLFGAWGGTHRLPAIVGQTNALDLTLSGRVITAQEALRMGLISRVVETPRSVAEEIATADRDALSRLKSLVCTPKTEAERDQEAREAETFATLIERHAEDLIERA